MQGLFSQRERNVLYYLASVLYYLASNCCSNASDRTQLEKRSPDPIILENSK